MKMRKHKLEMIWKIRICSSQQVTFMIYFFFIEVTTDLPGYSRSIEGIHYPHRIDINIYTHSKLGTMKVDVVLTQCSYSSFDWQLIFFTVQGSLVLGTLSVIHSREYSSGS